MLQFGQLLLLLLQETIHCKLSFYLIKVNLVLRHQVRLIFVVWLQAWIILVFLFTVKWYMQSAVQAHEEVHLSRFEPGLEAVAPQIEALFEVLTVSDTGQMQAAAIANIKVLANFATATNSSRTLWFNETATLIANDYNPGGPPDQTEHKIVDPMIQNICNARTVAERSACPACPP